MDGSPFESLTKQFLTSFDHRGFDNIPSPDRHLNYHSSVSALNGLTTIDLTRSPQKPSPRSFRNERMVVVTGTNTATGTGMSGGNFMANLRAGGDPDPSTAIMTGQMFRRTSLS
jgi:hypothetical protein